MYDINGVTFDVKNIINGKLDQLNPHLFDTLLSDFVGTSEISRAFVTQLCQYYLETLRRLPSNPAIVQAVASGRAAQLEAIAKNIENENAGMLNTKKRFDAMISKLELHGPRRHLQRLRVQRADLLELAQKRIDRLQNNPEHIADSRTLRHYGALVAERVYLGLNEVPLTTRMAFLNTLKIATKKPEFLELNTLYNFEHGYAGLALMVDALSKKREDPKAKPVYEAMKLSRKCSEILDASESKTYPLRILRPTISQAVPDLTRPQAMGVVDFLAKALTLSSTDNGFELKGSHATHLVDAALLEAECPALASLLASLTSRDQAYTPEYAAMYLRGTIHHWVNGGRRLPGHRNAYIDAITQLEKRKDGSYQVFARIHTVEKHNDGVVVALPPLEASIAASKDWLNAAYPGAVSRLAIGESLGLLDNDLVDYVFSAAAPAQQLDGPEMDDLSFF